MRKFRVKCIQISGVGRLLFGYGAEITEAQVNDADALVKNGSIEEITEVSDEKKKVVLKDKQK